MSDAWQPSAAIDTLVRRAELLQRIRAFFQDREIVEVQTATLDHYGVTDVAIENIEVYGYGYLQSSPEYQMKRLLAAGMPSCYQIGPAFRSGEVGTWHNTEFTMLEWYQLSIPLETLMSEVAALIDCIVGPALTTTITVGDLLRDAFDFDAYHANETEFLALACNRGLIGGKDLHDAADYLVTEALAKIAEPRVFLTEYPSFMSALAKIERSADHLVSRRFELIVNGLEIANGYDELRDVNEFLRRSAHDNERRARLGLPHRVLDRHLVAAMEHGLPECCGVAVGLDRLFALALVKRSIQDVLAFVSTRE